MPKISVIVPIYNTEKYLHRCIDSILTQTFNDLELLLIDDGSIDKSGVICDEYAKKDTRIRVFHKENGGVSSARNLGLDNAKGEWITFVDSDDWIENDAYNSIAMYNDKEIIINSFLMYYEGKYYKEGDISLCVSSKKQKDDFLAKYLHTGLLTTVCSKIYKRDIIGSIRFDKDVIVGEDTLFFLNVIVNATQIQILDNPYYIYRMFAFTDKYTLSVNDSICCMQKLWSSYENLEVRIPLFEKKLFCNHKSYCQLQIEQTPNVWYNNKFVQELYSRIKKFLTLEYRVRYRLMKYKLLRKFVYVYNK